MDAVPVRQLQQHASAVLRRVRGGETIAITDRGVIVAVLAPPADVGGMAALSAAGRLRPPIAEGPLPVPELAIGRPAIAVLDELRADR